MTEGAGPGSMATAAAQPAALGTATNPRPHRWLALVGWLALCYAVAAASSYATAVAIPTWYARLVKPGLTPPDWIFAPVWTLIYAVMAVAAWLAWRTRASSCRRRGIRLFLVVLLLNLTWVWLFFAIHRPGLALIEIAVLAVGISLTMQAFARMNRIAAWLLAPYLAWVAFAAYLNWGIWRLNT